MRERNDIAVTMLIGGLILMGVGASFIWGWPIGVLIAGGVMLGIGMVSID